MTIGFVDVHYDGSAARAACVSAESWENESPIEAHVLHLAHVEPYAPGSFYRRELPCLLSVLRLLGAQPEVIVIDGYVWLSSTERPGLGAHLYDALGRKVSVVGIAKTAFVGVERSVAVAPVYRGCSRKPLYVTAAGMDLAAAAEGVRRMAGKYRIPNLAKRVDRLSRSTAEPMLSGVE